METRPGIPGVERKGDCVHVIELREEFADNRDTIMHVEVDEVVSRVRVYGLESTGRGGRKECRGLACLLTGFLADVHRKRYRDTAEE